MLNKLFIGLLIGCFSVCYCRAQDIYIPRFTNINPVSYTDVVYTGIKDTVLISTYSGRISRIINGDLKEKVIAKIDDEIYALAYNPKSNTIAAATLENGILLIDGKSGKIIRQLPLPSSWAVTINYSDNYQYLFTYDQNRQRYIWDVSNSYKQIQLKDDLPKGIIIRIDRKDIATIIGTDKIVFWDLKNNALQKEWAVTIDKFGDLDSQGNVLSINFNECVKYNTNKKAIEFKLKHPNWPLPNPENPKEVYDIPCQMEITAAKFSRNKIYTGSIDRTVRVWDKNTGKLITTLTGHKGSVSKVKVSANEKQVVSVDLKGVIKFWNVE